MTDVLVYQLQNPHRNIGIQIEDRITGIHILEKLKAEQSRVDHIKANVDMSKVEFFEEMKEKIRYFEGPENKKTSATDAFFQNKGRFR